jgi:deoxyribodipyrimidine photolyase-related protein
MSHISIVFPNQLFEHHPAIGKKSKVYLVEEYLFFKEFPFHQQKIAFHRASMKAFAEHLEKKGVPVVYIDSTDPRSDVRILIKYLAENGMNELQIVEVTDNWLEKRIKESCKKYQVVLQVHSSPMFLNTLSELASYFTGKKRLRQTDFYIEQRKRRQILLDAEGKALGGRWTYDSDNRKKYPKKKRVPKLDYALNDKHYSEARTYVKKHFSDHPGVMDESIQYPVDFEQSKRWLDHFLFERFHDFGTYQDAIVAEEPTLHHSLISPMLNVGLLTPGFVIEKSINHYRAHQIPLNSAEGFVRQILGWREFLRGVYHFQGSFQRTRNFWGFKRKIPPSFWEGSSGLFPVDLSIQKINKSAYAHHIERLMILGNIMLLAEFDPDEVYRWFMSLFIDAYDWVMVPNVYGMSQFADGGLFATKPYISGSNYLTKMSDLPKGEWESEWTALFWRFIHKHRKVLSKNSRLTMLIRTFDRMPAEKQKSMLQQAGKVLNRWN